MEKLQNLKNNNINVRNVVKIGIRDNPLIKNNKHYLQEIIDKILNIMEIGYIIVENKSILPSIHWN